MDELDEIYYRASATETERRERPKRRNVRRPPGSAGGPQFTARLLQHLKWHHAAQDRSATKSQLASALHTGTRQVEGAIQTLRGLGEMICSDGRGYWITTDPDEWDEQIDALARRIHTQMETVAQMRRARDERRRASLAAHGGQHEIFGG